MEADLWQQSDTLSMYNVMQVPGLANGRASLVEGFRATDATGTSLPLKDLGAATIRCPYARFEAVFGAPATR